MSLLGLLATGLAAVVVLALAVTVAGLAWYVHRERRQPVFPQFWPGPGGRRETGRRAHPDEDDTSELPLIEQNGTLP